MGRLSTDASGGGRGGRSPAARPTARPAAVSRAAEPALRPGLTGTRRRKRRRGPYRPGGRPEERRGRGARDTEANIIPSRAETPRPVGTQRSAVAARAQRAHTRAMKPTPARGVEAEVRGHGYRGDCGRDFLPCGWMRPGARWLRTCRGPVSSPRTVSDPPRSSNEDSGSSKRLPEHARRAGTHGRAVVPGWHGQSEIERAAAVRMIARGCAPELQRGRGSACGGGFQPLDHGVVSSRGFFAGVEPARTLLKVPTPWTFFSLLLAKPRLGAV